MKTKQEIEDRIEAIKNFEIELYYLGKISCVIDNLKWVLEDSEPKRTIFALTEDELKELFDVVCPNYAYEIISVNKGNYVNAIVFTLACPADGFNIYTVSIHNNLSINISYGNKPEHIYNQAKYIDRIREMLSKSKEEIK